MRTIVLLFLLFCGIFPAAAKKHGPVQAVWICERKQLTEGDSCLVSLVLLSQEGIDRVQLGARPKTKGGTLRRLPVAPTVDRVRSRRPDGRGYILLNRVVCARFVAKAEAPGKISVKPLTVKVAVAGRKQAVSVATEKWTLPVAAKPQKTNRELMRRGGFL